MTISPLTPNTVKKYGIDSYHSVSLVPADDSHSTMEYHMIVTVIGSGRQFSGDRWWLAHIYYPKLRESTNNVLLCSVSVSLYVRVYACLCICCYVCNEISGYWPCSQRTSRTSLAMFKLTFILPCPTTRTRVRHLVWGHLSPSSTSPSHVTHLTSVSRLIEFTFVNKSMNHSSTLFTLFRSIPFSSPLCSATFYSFLSYYRSLLLVSVPVYSSSLPHYSQFQCLFTIASSHSEEYFDVFFLFCLFWILYCLLSPLRKFPFLQMFANDGLQLKQNVVNHWSAV